MMQFLIFILSISSLFGETNKLSAYDIIKNMDLNLNSKNRVLISEMVIHGRRKSRTIKSKSWSIGTEKAFTENISPAREAGTKMLKLGNKLWTYAPQTDRVIQISGHMLRQSVNGSDMSYKDMMETRPISEIYDLKLEESVSLNNRDHWVVYMVAKVKGLSYPKRRTWIDKEYFLSSKEELYAKSGKLLKTTSSSNIKKVQGRWFPHHYKFKDELKRNSKGTEWIISKVEFDIDISKSRFSKALLRK
tara:strand:- start:181 stop:921 length:741 start_codon:yes stop_codon:yes gene_type:complete